MSLFEEIYKYLKNYPDNEFYEGASRDELDETEQLISPPLPEPVRKFYEMSNGAVLFYGSLTFFPLYEGGLSVKSAGRLHRSAGWHIPDELVVFGDNGAGELYAYWAPDKKDAVILQIGDIKEPHCLSIVATSFEKFLFLQSILLTYADGEQQKIGELPIPEDLKKKEYSGDDMADLLLWIDPERPHIPYDPYEARLTLDDIKKLMDNNSQAKS